MVTGFHRKLMQSVLFLGGLLAYAATVFSAGRNQFAKELQLVTQGDFFNDIQFSACGFVMSMGGVWSQG